MGSELRVENLKFKNILTDINFTLKEGTITALMGKNGCGKTLLFKSLFGLIDVVGEIYVNGNIITKNNIEDMRKNFGIYLETNKLENKSVFSSIMEPLINLNYSIDSAKEKVFELSKKLGIDNLLYKDINTLSHTEKKIVLFAQSIIHEPKIILIDNLFQSLDEHYKNKVFTYLKQLKKSNKSIVLFTSNNSEDLWIADNLVMLKNGKILANDSVKELIEDESLFLKNNINLPFLVDLSHKLRAYNLIDKILYNTKEMVDEIWQ